MRKNTAKDAARLLLARLYNNVENLGLHSFNVIASTFYEHYDEILNFFNNHSTNAMAESFNSKIKLFRANLRVWLTKNSSYFVSQNYSLIPTNFLLNRYLLSDYPYAFFQVATDFTQTSATIRKSGISQCSNMHRGPHQR